MTRASRVDMITELASDRVTNAADTALRDYRTFHGWLQPLFIAQLEAELADRDDASLADYYTEQLGTPPAGWDGEADEADCGGERWFVRFHPQAWVGGHALDVDVDSDPSWNVTQEIEHLTPEERARAVADDQEVLDHLRHLRTCPRWIREWPGPFRLEIVSGPRTR